jgi:membrane fusion protein
MSSLFRQEAVENKTQKIHGTILLTQTWSNASLAWALVAIVATLIAFAFTFGFSRQATVQGVIVPAGGVSRILAPQSATVTAVNVSEGDIVKVGDPLFIISSERISEQGDTQAAIKESLMQRTARLNKELTYQASQDVNKQHDLQERLFSLTASLQQLDSEIALQKQKVQLAHDVATRVGELAKTGQMSKITASEKAAEHLEQESRLASIEMQRHALQRDITALSALRTDSSLQSTREASQLQREIEELKQQLTEHEARRQLVIRAEQAGRIAAVVVTPGQAVLENQRVASILPEPSLLEAELYAPSRDVGLIGKDTKVSLRYDAFPYQKFGQFKGKVREITQSTILPAELNQYFGNGQTATLSAEPVYRIRVKLNAQDVKAKGNKYALKPGMQLSASLILEHRTLAEWIFEPLADIASGHYGYKRCESLDSGAKCRSTCKMKQPNVVCAASLWSLTTTATAQTCPACDCALLFHAREQISPA